MSELIPNHRKRRGNEVRESRVVKSEKFGIPTFPADPTYPALNLAQAAAICLYELRRVTHTHTHTHTHSHSQAEARRRRTPFRPFTVALVNGDRFEVDHPNALVVRDGVAVYIGAGGIPVLFDHEGLSQVIDDFMDQQNH